ncbi:fructosamine kinase family protein [Sporolactobacillus inulinus]|uniref:Ribulosamine/erythrulosamine 3-kinase n=2 Tax=Sporolactobacillus inulinus TaxID=2078 RepID=A0A4Y3T1H8_9BACL|nr:fructosamine kinase family protein [Sporolactobacillus inulinus]KLI03813.1 hypothetical protein SINU_00685 [Sporolactobacillus inulinus CASD]GAY76016.1 ribulosamine/erythrulosamine 3-kinase [Sporolactobacillus inulinus]GEB76106.1 aminoglycoside phosphotransferase [Sporolactobacillus inulinus]
MLSNQIVTQLPLKSIDGVQSVPGGDINDAYSIDSGDQRYFLKLHKHTDDNFFTSEATGLALLGRVARTPKVIHKGVIGTQDYLILEWIEQGTRRNEAKLGRVLAQVHRQTDPLFGFAFNSYAGKLPQDNRREKDWATFYLERKLGPLIGYAAERGYWNVTRQQAFERFAERFAQTYKNRTVTPSLLHGDLWGGNIMYDRNGDPVLIDPSVFYGNREMDLAMTLLFGGFGSEFYQAYQEAYPLEEGWRARVPWYQLYYLLCHLIMFGEGYGAAVDHALRS